MQKTVSLNCLYADYVAGRLEKGKFEGMIFEAISEKKYRLCGLGKEDYEDFVSWLYPRISRAIDNYHSMGASFEAYMNKLIHMAAKEYRWQHLRHYNTEIAAWTTQIPDMYANEMELEYCRGSEVADVQSTYAPQAEVPWNIRNSRQLLILILKCCRYVSNDFIENISPRLGMTPDALIDMIDRLKERREKREAQVDALRELANYQFCRCLFYERTLYLAKDTPLVAQRIKAKLEYWRRKLDRTRERLGKLYLDPSNAQIAEALGLTKGAVDAALHTLKTTRRMRIQFHDKGAKDKHMLN